MYLHGPYSPVLAKDYYNISSEEWKIKSETAIMSDDDLGFIVRLKDKDPLWLETAATLYWMGEGENNWEKAADSTYSVKKLTLSRNDKDKRYVMKVLEDMKSMNIVR